MSWNCRLINYTDRESLQVGDMFYADKRVLTVKSDPDSWKVEWPHFFATSEKLSPHYFQHNSHRLPLLVQLPGNVLWCVDSRIFNNGEWGDHGWTVTGAAPYITVSPSINIGGIYHGFLVDGVIGDDVEGRTFSIN